MLCAACPSLKSGQPPPTAAGMEEGGVCAWDLEEAPSRHPHEAVEGRRLCTRRPSYTNEGQVGVQGQRC